MTASPQNPPADTDPSATGLRGWRAQRRTTQAKAKRNSRRVRRMRILFPAIAGVLVAAFFAGATVKDVDETFVQLIVGRLPSTDGEPQILNPSFTWSDEVGRNYEVEADAAVQNQTRRNVVHLVNPRARLSPESVDGAAIESTTGTFIETDQLLLMDGDVVLNYRDDYVFRTEAAAISLDDKRMFGDSPVRGEGALGDLEAKGFEVLDGGERVVFTGDVKLVLNARGGDEAAGKAGEHR